MKIINFTKMNGAGNDFIVIDSSKNESISLSANIIKKLCRRRKGIGADGILFIEPTKEYDYKLTYFNSDGSLGSLCGNGSRCSIKYAVENFTTNGKKPTFVCNNEIYTGQIINGETVSFDLKEPKDIKLNFKIKYDKSEIMGHFIDTGSPHAVFLWDDIKSQIKGTFFTFSIYEFGKKIRNSKEFSPEGTNVNVITTKKEELFIRTYERGVENETLSCGTGNVAAAVILNFIKKYKAPITINTFGGDQLIVDFMIKKGEINKITLTGPEKLIILEPIIFNYGELNG